MRDGLVTLPSLGQTAGNQYYKRLNSRNICLPIYHTTVSRRSQEPRQKKSPFGGRDQTTTAGVEAFTYSRSFSGVDHT
jgi:hypothetical protein